MEKGVRKVVKVEPTESPIEFYFDEGYMGIKKDGKETLSQFKMKDSLERTTLVETLNKLIN